MKLSTSRILISAMLLAILPVLALQAPTQAATTRLADGQSQATAAGSCWEIKQNNPSSTNGIYWLVTPALQAPHGYVLDKVESFAIDAAGNAFVITDNDGVDDHSGETQFLRLGRIALPM